MHPFALALCWFLFVPPAAARVAQTIAHERIFAGLRAYVEARYPYGLLDSLVGCPVCLSCWCVLGSLPLFLWADWPTLCVVPWPLLTLAGIFGWLAAWELTVTWWLREPSL